MEALDSSDAKISELFVEQLDDGVSVRSRECELAMVSGLATCPACVGLAKKLCPEDKPSSSSPSSSPVVIKVKPDLPEVEAESEEVKYMYAGLGRTGDTVTAFPEVPPPPGNCIWSCSSLWGPWNGPGTPIL